MRPPTRKIPNILAPAQEGAEEYSILVSMARDYLGKAIDSVVGQGGHSRSEKVLTRDGSTVSCNLCRYYACVLVSAGPLPYDTDMVTFEALVASDDNGHAVAGVPILVAVQAYQEDGNGDRSEVAFLPPHRNFMLEALRSAYFQEAAGLGNE